MRKKKQHKTTLLGSLWNVAAHRIRPLLIFPLLFFLLYELFLSPFAHKDHTVCRNVCCPVKLRLTDYHECLFFFFLTLIFLFLFLCLLLLFFCLLFSKVICSFTVWPASSLPHTCAAFQKHFRLGLYIYICKRLRFFLFTTLIVSSHLCAFCAKVSSCFVIPLLFSTC